jgi:hypothetical protein
MTLSTSLTSGLRMSEEEEEEDEPLLPMNQQTIGYLTHWMKNY